MTPMYDIPDHMLIPVDDAGEGPVDEADAVRWVCWCRKGALCDIEPPQEDAP